MKPHPARRTAAVLALGMPTVLFLITVACLGITNGHRFIDNAFIAVVYCWFCTGLAAFPLLAWRRGRGHYADPGLTWAMGPPFLFTTMQGLAYNAPDNIGHGIVLALGWAAFVFAGMVCLYFLGRALWFSTDDRAAPRGSGPVEQIKEPGASS
ncbi:hypothetical protein ACFVUW_10990 [Streptomyces xiamenensis]|uniref:hypothetical protein n=1 Tax=Streptomyces xiamenensis TaxID=408015 RepID=UPI0036ECE677